MKKAPGLMIAALLKPKKGARPDEEEDESMDNDEAGDALDHDGDDEAALEDMGTRIGEALGTKPKDPVALAKAVCDLMDLHKEMKDADEG